MSAIDTTFERVFEEMRAERQESPRGDPMAASDRLELEKGLRQLDERLGRIAFRAAGILATGLIALVATQL